MSNYTHDLYVQQHEGFRMESGCVGIVRSKRHHQGAKTTHIKIIGLF